MSEFFVKQAMMEAIDLQKRNQLDDAKAIYKKVVQQDSKNADAFHLLSLIDLVQGDLNSAKENISNAIDLQPDIAIYHSNFGNILYHSNDLEFALKEHKKAIKLDKKIFQSFYSLGIIYAHLKNYEKSIESYKKAIDINKDSSEAHNNLANVYNVVNPKEAEYHYERVVELSNSDPIPYINISNYYLKNVKYKKCVETLEQALDKKIEAKELYNNLGIAYLATKNNEKSKEMFKLALKIDNAYKPALDNLKNLEGVS